MTQDFFSLWRIAPVAFMQRHSGMKDQRGLFMLAGRHNKALGGFSRMRPEGEYIDAAKVIAPKGGQNIIQPVGAMDNRQMPAFDQLVEGVARPYFKLYIFNA